MTRVRGLRRFRPLGLLVAAAALLGGVHLLSFSLQGTANLALVYTIIGVSLVLLTGWVGQISLAQASFVGLGAFVTGLLVRDLGVPFPLTLPLAGTVAGAVAGVLGVVALRVRGLYLAVATLIFAWMVQEWLFNQSFIGAFGGASTAPSKPLGVEGTVPYFDFTQRPTFYYMALGVAGAVMLGAANLRDSRTGRAWFAVKGSEIAAASLGINVTRYKLAAFATSGAMAGMAGCLMMTHFETVTATSFTISVSLFYLSIAVVGGLNRLSGAAAGAVLFAGLEEVFFRVDALAGLLDVVSAGLLAAALLFFPDGLVGIPARVAHLTRRLWRTGRPDAADTDIAEEPAPEALEAEVLSAELVADAREEEAGREEDEEEAPEPEVEESRSRWRLGRRDDKWVEVPDALARVQPRESQEEVAPAEQAQVAPDAVYVPGTATKPDLPPRSERQLVLAARDITVRFGGLTAVDGAGLEVREGEVVGLIGPNGAGKTTLFNAILGLNQPAAGSVELYGRDITSLPVHERTQRGISRTFQVIQLFPQLTVFDNLLVATHLRNPTGFYSHLLASSQAVVQEAQANRRVQQVVELLGLDDVAHRSVGGLPFGTLRLVEIARALVTGAPFMMLDEPASGLDNAETDRLIDLLLWVRQSLGVTILLIEHDVPMVTRMSDYIYVVNRGQLIAEGTPVEVQRNQLVIDAYLGTSSHAAETVEVDKSHEHPEGEASNEDGRLPAGAGVGG